MDFIFGLVFLWFIYSFFAGFSKKSKRTNKPSPWNTPSRENKSDVYTPEDVRDAQEFEELKAQVKTITKQQAVQFGRRAVKNRKAGLNDDGDIHVINPAHNLDMQDKNIHRREDWGSRAGPGILSTANILILIALGLVGMLLVQYLSLL